MQDSRVLTPLRLEPQHGRNTLPAVRWQEVLPCQRLCRRQFPSGAVPGKPRHGSDPCPACGWQLSDPTQTFCVTCGHYDPQLRAGKQAAAGGEDAASG